jgi:regulator of CtrA degradation
MRQRQPLDIFLDKAYDDGFALLIEVRDFLKDEKAAIDAALAPNERVLLTEELTRMTRRLTDVMAWLLLRRAVAAGDISHRESLSHAATRLGDDPPDEPVAAHRRLPLNVRGMIGRTRRLYGDVLKLKETTEQRAS